MKLNFRKGAGLILRGALQVIGTREKPVILSSVSDDMRWSGIYVMSAKKTSKINHAEIHNTTYMKHENLKLTGGITFYKSDLEVDHLSIDGTSAEDAINVVHADFVAKNLTITNTRSDAFDGDYVTGKLRQGVFRNIGGDAVDFSGSQYAVSDSIFTGVRDKAVSAGEQTKIKVAGISVNHSGTGVASKDGSLVEVINSRFENIAHFDLMAYRKKQEYKSAYLSAKSVSSNRKSLRIVAQKGSKILLNGAKVRSIKIDIDKIYKEGYMKK